MPGFGVEKRSATMDTDDVTTVESGLVQILIRQFPRRVLYWGW